MLAISSLLTRFRNAAGTNEAEHVSFPNCGPALVMPMIERTPQEATWRCMPFVGSAESATMIAETTGHAPTNALVVEDRQHASHRTPCAASCLAGS